MKDLTQKQLLDMYIDSISKETWNGDKEMVDYERKTTAYIYQLENGDLIQLEKPTIEKDFCFGYGYCGLDYTEANDMVNYARTNEDYFIEQNLEPINAIISHLKDKVVKYAIKYTNAPENTKIKVLVYQRYNEDDNLPLITETDRNGLIKMYEQLKADFTKRLNTYLKRYGLSKIKAWTYWADR